MKLIACVFATMFLVVGCSQSKTESSQPEAPINARLRQEPQRKQVLTLTSAASDQILAVQESYDSYLRVGVTPGGCTGFTYQLEFTEYADPEKDYVCDHSGVKVLVDRKSALYLDGTSLDYRVEGDRVGFAFDNPNAKKTVSE